MINKTMALFMLAGLAHTGLAQAALPADVSVAPACCSSTGTTPPAAAMPIRPWRSTMPLAI